MNLRSIPLALTLNLVSSLAAQTGQVSRDIDVGTADWGARIHVAGHSSYSDTAIFLGHTWHADCGFEASTSARMDGRLREACFVTAGIDTTITSAFDLRLRTNALSGVESNVMAIRINGNTVFSFVGDKQITQAVDLLPLNLFGNHGFDDTVQVGPYTVVLHENMTSDVSATMTPRLSISGLTAGLHLSTSAQIEGTAGASLSAFGVTVGVDSLLDYGTPTSTLDMSTDFHSASLAASFVVDWIRLHFDVFARALGFEYRLHIVNIDVPPVSRSTSVNF